MIVDTTILDVLKEGKFKILSPKDMNRLLKETADEMIEDMKKKQPIKYKETAKKKTRKTAKETADKKSKETANRFRGCFQKRS